MTTTPKKIILASSSAYRAELLGRVNLKFSAVTPAFEETREIGEKPRDLAIRLAFGKAESIVSQYPDALIIGSDQVAHLDEEILDKPGNFETAFRQLEAVSGKWATFTTSIVLLNKTGNIRMAEADEFQIRFRKLSSRQITSYLKADQPWDCAGSIRAEALGVTLFKETRGQDVNTLYGLPLMLLTDLLKKLDIDLIKGFS